jgi:hypothetical protein
VSEDAASPSSSSLSSPPARVVVGRADDLFDLLWARSQAFAEREDRNGYFAALYTLMTGRVAQGLRLGRFTNPDRLERLTCHFAMRYLDAFDAHERGEPAPHCWVAAFEASTRRRPIILQHLLLGMNAHINFDLGIAAAEVSDGHDLASLRADFDEINVVLAELLGDVQERLAQVSPWMGILDRLGGRKDDAIVNFSMRTARDEAWRVAEQFAPLDAPGRAAAQTVLDDRIAHLARVVARPGVLLTCATTPIRLREHAPVGEVIAALMRPTAAS